MKCRDIQFELPLFADNILSDGERRGVEEHLARCPLCRQQLSDYQELRTGLRDMSRPRMPLSVLESVRASVREALAVTGTTPAFHLIETRRRWTDVWLMPSAIAGVTTLVCGFMLLAGMMTTNVQPGDASVSSPSTSTSVYLSSVDGQAVLTPSNYARSRMAVAGESPSVNPQGALVALTRSLVRGEMKDDEVVVVADVFGNGLAQIAEVVEPSHDRRAVAQLQKALESDPAYAPFVSAEMDQRSDPVRVVLKIQSVNVNTGLSKLQR
ncbi:MAG: anti-sigma factor [Acidobacteriota bacterium]